MKFEEFINNQAQLDNEKNTYTRYIVEYNKQLNMPILVALTTGNSDVSGKHFANIAIYETSLPGNIKKLISCDEGYKKSITDLIRMGDFEVSEKPISKLNSCSFSKTKQESFKGNSSEESTEHIECVEDNVEVKSDEILVRNYANVYGDHAVITDVSTQDDYVRCGLGSYAVQVIQDYYKKTDYLSLDKKGRKVIYAQRKRMGDNVVYETGAERNLGKMGTVLAHARAKLLGKNQSSEKVYDSFLAKNNFNITTPAPGWTKKPIYHDRHILSESLLNEGVDRPVLVQMYDEFNGDILDVSSMISEKY